MCISRSWLFFRVYKRANALLIKILIQKLSFHKSNHFLTHNLDFWIKLLTIFQTVDLFNKIITAKTLQNFFWFSNCEVRTLQTPTNTWNCYGYWLDERLITHMKKKKKPFTVPSGPSILLTCEKIIVGFPDFLDLYKNLPHRCKFSVFKPSVHSPIINHVLTKKLR